jgi:hypothetical protein
MEEGTVIPYAVALRLSRRQRQELSRGLAPRGLYLQALNTGAYRVERVVDLFAEFYPAVRS